MQNYFDLFNLPHQFIIDAPLLDLNYRKLQTAVHPDKFVTASPNERMQSMQLATTANEAYQTLKNPTARARYMLQLQGIDSLENSNTAMPMDFLMLQMEWRETLEDAKSAHDIDALNVLLSEMQQLNKAIQHDVANALDNSQDKEHLELATELVRKLSFIDKVQADVKQAITKLETTV